MAKRVKPLVIIPAKNEEATIGRVVQDIKDNFVCDVLVVDDSSSDKTADEARGAGATLLALSIHLGAWGGIQAGLRYALCKGYGPVVTFDADGQHCATKIPDLLRPIEANTADVVIGSFPQRGSVQRKVAWRLFKWLTGLDLYDLTSGFRVYNQEAVSLLASQEATLLDYQDLGVLLLLQKSGLRVAEVQTEMFPRLSGHSRVFSSWWVVFLYMVDSCVLSVCKRNRQLIPKRS